MVPKSTSNQHHPIIFITKYLCTHPSPPCNWVGLLSKNLFLIHDPLFFPKHCLPIDGLFIIEIYTYTHPSPPCNWVGIRIQNWFQNRHQIQLIVDFSFPKLIPVPTHRRHIIGWVYDRPILEIYTCTHPSPPCNWVGILFEHRVQNQQQTSLF